MKIVVPLTNIQEISALKENGAREFYMGYIPYEWLNNYFNFLPLNGRERMYANFSFHSSSMLRELSRVNDVETYITINGHYYNQNAYEIVLKIVEFLYSLNFKNYIIADYFLIRLLEERYSDICIAISGDMGIFNSLSLKYLLDNFKNIKRIIFPRKTPLDDMKKIIQNLQGYNVEYEAFCLNELCYYSGVYCNAFHCDELLRICRVPKKLVNYEGKVLLNENFDKRISNLSSNTDVNTYVLGKSGCGICKINEMREIGITHLKLVGRGKKLEHLLNDLRILNEIVECKIEHNGFETFTKEKYYNSICPKDCYYI